VKSFSQGDLFSLTQTFRREGFINIPQVMPQEFREAMREEALRLLADHAERRDLRLETTGNTPRKMRVVHSEFIADNSELVRGIYDSPASRARRW